MRKVQLLLILLFICQLGVVAQNNQNSLDGFGYMDDPQLDPTMRTGMQDSSNVEIISLAPRMHMWKIT